jgi:hypothetical protein
MAVKARLTVKRWEEDATKWSLVRQAAIVFARAVTDEAENVTALFAVYGRGNILTGESAQAAIAAGVAEEIAE